MQNLGNFKCPQCGWVHAGISEVDAMAAVADFNHYYQELSTEAQADFGGQPSSLDMYVRCFKCGAPASDFIPAEPSDAPNGCTLQVVIAPVTRMN